MCFGGEATCKGFRGLSARALTLELVKPYLLEKQTRGSAQTDPLATLAFSPATGLTRDVDETCGGNFEALGWVEWAYDFQGLLLDSVLY